MSYKGKYMKYKEKYLALKNGKYLDLLVNKAKYLGLKEQVGGVTNDQRIFLNNELTSHINKLRQAEMTGGPPPAPAMMPEYNHEELEELLNKSNGEIIPGEININMDMFENDRVYGIRRNSRNYIIFTNGNVDTIKSIREFID
jgi:hypothetical protein